MRIFTEIKGALKSLLIPGFLIGLIILALWITLGGQDKSTHQAIYGLMFGVALGFSVDILKRSLEEIGKDRALKKTVQKILEQDAKDIYRTVWLYTSLLESDKVPSEVKEQVRKQIPPAFKLRYWKRIKENEDFLLVLGSDPWFNEVYGLFFDVEEINDQIERAQGADPRAYQFAQAFYQTLIESKNHEELLEKFVGEKGVKEFKEGLIEKSGGKQKK